MGGTPPAHLSRWLRPGVSNPGCSVWQSRQSDGTRYLQAERPNSRLRAKRSMSSIRSITSGRSPTAEEQRLASPARGCGNHASDFDHEDMHTWTRIARPSAAHRKGILSACHGHPGSANRRPGEVLRRANTRCSKPAVAPRLHRTPQRKGSRSALQGLCAAKLQPVRRRGCSRPPPYP